MAIAGARVRALPSRIEGTGVFAVHELRARRKIGELDGERISVREGRRRAASRQRIHIVELDERHAVDASRGASPLRFLNHSCEPNAYIRIAYGRIEVYALHAIAAGEELTADYGETHHEGRLPCKCGAADCNGFL